MDDPSGSHWCRPNLLWLQYLQRYLVFGQTVGVCVEQLVSPFKLLFEHIAIEVIYLIRCYDRSRNNGDWKTQKQFAVVPVKCGKIVVKHHKS